jgi:hypothetical protein
MIDMGEASASFLKKRSKKLLVLRAGAAPAVSGRGAGVGVKVFWFFFSKKNRFPTGNPQ